ncbi:MAG: hypothetical protein U0414_07325 [Polyangiaceae bacterium]
MSTEVELDAPLTTAATSGAQVPGAPASNGSTWAFPLTGDVSGVSSVEVFRVDAGGQIVDASPIVLQTNLSYSGASAAASDGTDFLVMWNPVSSAAQSRAARVTAGGAVLDAGGFSAPNFSAGSSVIFAGGNYWYSVGPRAVRRISPAGVLLDATDQTFANQTFNAFGVNAKLAAIGNTIAAVWAETSATDGLFFARRFDTNLVPIDATPIQLGGPKTSYKGAIASNGSSFLISYDDCVVRLGTSGPASAALCTTPVIGSLVPDGANYIARSTGQELWRLDANGNRLTMPASAFGDGTNRISIAMSRSSTDLALHYLVGVTGKTATFTRFNPATLAPIPPVDRVGASNITLTGNVERRPEVAAGPTGWMVAWEDYRSPQGVYGVHVGANGQPTDASAALLYAATPKDEPIPFAAGSQGDYMLIAANKAIRVLPNGSVAAPVALDTNFQLPATGISGLAPRIARGPNGYLVAVSVTQTPFSDGKAQEDYFLDDVGNTIKGPILVGQSGTFGEYAIASDGTNYMQVFRKEDFPGQLGKLFLKMFDPTGNLLFASPEFMPAADYQSMWLAASTGGSDVYLLVYDLGGAIRAQRLDAATGALLDVGPIDVASGHEPRVAFDGTDFWVTWHATSATDYDVFARRVSKAGALVDAAPIVVSNHTTPATPAHGHELSPTLGFQSGHGLVAYMYDDPADGYHGFRARARLLEPLGCSIDADCSGGLVCVNATCVAPSTSSVSASSSVSTSSSVSASSSVAATTSTGVGTGSSTSSGASTGANASTGSGVSTGTGGAGGANGSANAAGGSCAFAVGETLTGSLWIVGAGLAIAARRRRRQEASGEWHLLRGTRAH